MSPVQIDLTQSTGNSHAQPSSRDRRALSAVAWHDMPRALVVTPDTPDPCTTWRVWWPCGELHARGYVADYIRYGDLNLIMPLLEHGRYTLLSTPRMAFLTDQAEEGWQQTITALRQAGVAWWYDADDDLFSRAFVERELESVPDEQHTRVEPVLERARASRIRCLRAADGITVASATLANQVCGLTSRPVVEVANGINVSAFTHAMSRKTRYIPPLVVGWSGGPRLEQDMEPVLDVWPALAAEYPELRFVTQGWCPPGLRQAMPPGRLLEIGGQPISEYPAELTNIDIFCLFARSDSWIEAKTPIKWFEATLAGAVCVASSALYGPATHPGQDALVATTADQWLEALRALVVDSSLRMRLKRAAMAEVCANHTTTQTYAGWLQAWSVSSGRYA